MENSLPGFAVAGVQDDVAGVGVDPDEARDFAGDAGFLAGFADGRLDDGLAEVDGAAGNGPVVVVGSLDQQDLAGVVVTTTLTDGTRLLAFGAAGSS